MRMPNRTVAAMKWRRMICFRCNNVLLQRRWPHPSPAQTHRTDLSWLWGLAAPRADSTEAPPTALAAFSRSLICFRFWAREMLLNGPSSTA